MNWRAQNDYWDPYKDSKNARNRVSPTYYYQNSDRRFSYQKKIGNIIITSSNSKDKNKIFQVKSTSKDKKSSQQNKPRLYIIDNGYFVEKKEPKNQSPPSHIHYHNKRLEMIPQSSDQVSKVRKSPIKIIKKTPPKRQKIDIPNQMVINTTVTAPSSVATSMLNNFQTNPDLLLGNMTDSKLERVFRI